MTITFILFVSISVVIVFLLVFWKTENETAKQDAKPEQDAKVIDQIRSLRVATRLQEWVSERNTILNRKNKYLPRSMNEMEATLYNVFPNLQFWYDTFSDISIPYNAYKNTANHVKEK